MHACQYVEVHHAGLDNLASPQGVIAGAQEVARAVFGARSTFFLVNGTTGGLHAAVAACCLPSTVLLVSRASHFAVFNAATLAGVPHFLTPRTPGSSIPYEFYWFQLCLVRGCTVQC
jgi:arginine/lysine/ornithine decarboxylase